MPVRDTSMARLLVCLNNINTHPELADQTTTVLMDVIDHLGVSEECRALVREASDLIFEHCIGDTGNLIGESMEAIRAAGYHVDITDYPGTGSRKLVVVFTQKGLIDG